MSDKREVVVLSGVRTAIGKYGGGLKDQPPSELAAAVVREAVKRAGVAPAEIGHVVFGNVIHTDAHDMYLARVAAVNGGLPVETPALTLNRLCGSGLQAIVSAAQAIMLGDVRCRGRRRRRGDEPRAVLAAGDALGRAHERRADARRDGRRADRSVRRLPHGHDRRECGRQMEDHARKTRTRWQSRATSARPARSRTATSRSRSCRSRSKAKAARRPSTPTRCTRLMSTLEGLAKLKPVFDKNGTVTAGNASGINDAAAAVVLMERAAGRGARAEAAGPAGRLRARRRRAEVHGHRPGAGRPQGAGSRRPDDRATSTCSRSTRRSPPRRWRSSANWSCRRNRPTRTAAASRSATRSAPPAAS